MERYQIIQSRCKISSVINIKTVLGVVAVFITIVSYFPYILDIIKGKTKPHIYSWFLFGFITLIAFALQVRGGAGFGSTATFVAAMLIVTVFFLSLKNWNNQTATLMDKLFFGLTILALILWLVAKQPIVSAILITLTNLLAYGPTIRKSWSQPHTETQLFFRMNILRFALIIVSLENYSILTALYPVSEFLIHCFMAGLLFVRSIKIKETKLLSFKSVTTSS